MLQIDIIGAYHETKPTHLATSVAIRQAAEALRELP